MKPTHPFRLIGHRGAPTEAPENSLGSFLAAAHAKASWVELDVQSLADGSLVVFHDAQLKRMTGKRGTLRHKSQADLVDYVLLGGQPIPTLSTVLNAMADHNVGVYVEMKDANADAVPRILETVIDSGAEVVLSSFHLSMLEQVRRQGWSGPTMALFSRATTMMRRAADQYDEIGIAWSACSGRSIHQMIQQGIRILAYTINEMPQIERAYQMGLSGVFTDQIRQAEPLFNQRTMRRMPR